MSKTASRIVLAAATAVVLGPQKDCWAFSTSGIADTSAAFVSTPFLPRLFQRAQAVGKSSVEASPRFQKMKAADRSAKGERMRSESARACCSVYVWRSERGS